MVNPPVNYSNILLIKLRGLDYLGTSAEHDEKAKHDFDHSADLLKMKKHRDWCIVSLFYCALHCVSSNARKNGIITFKPKRGEKTTFHRKRIDYVQNNLTGFFTIYTRLYDLARQCRYDPAFYLTLKDKTVEKLHKQTLFKAKGMYLFKK